MSTRELIEPILTKTYGSGEMVTRLADHLARKIDGYDGDALRERITLICWDWFSGGATAASVADRIVAALDAREPAS